MPNGTDGAPDPTEFYLYRRLGAVAADPTPPSESSVTLYGVEVVHKPGAATEQSITIYNAAKPRPAANTSAAAHRAGAAEQSITTYNPAAHPPAADGQSITIYNAYTRRPAVPASPAPAPRIPAAPPMNWTPPFQSIHRFRWKVAKEAVVRLNGDTAAADQQHLAEKYRIEAVDPRHRMADALNPLRAYFRSVVDGTLRNSLAAFFEWLEFVLQNHPDWVREHLEGARINPLVIGAFMNRVSVYQATSLARATTRITFLGGKMFRCNEEVFDTRGMVTAFSGQGWAIYVVSPSGHWFCSNHRVGKLHHSTLLRGRPVIAAGEIQVEGGVPKLISAKSGHYRPTMEHFIAGIRSLRENGASMTTLQVRVFDKSNNKVEMPAAQFLNDPSPDTTYKVWDL